MKDNKSLTNEPIEPIKPSNQLEFMQYFIIIIVSILILIPLRIDANSTPYIKDNPFNEQTQKARVIEIFDKTENFIESSTGIVSDVYIYFSANIKDIGTINAFQNINSYGSPDLKEVEIGDEVLVTSISYDENLDFVEWYFSGYVKFDVILSLLITFGLSLILFGKLKGFKTLISLSFTIFAVFMVFIPAVLSGKNIYTYTIIISTYTILTTLLMVGGFTKKIVPSILGCLIGVLFTGFLTIFIDNSLELTGMINSDSLYLINLRDENPINLNGIIFAMIVIGAMGAVMDVSISISSSIWELSQKSSISQNELFSSGINIGRDIMGTMANTLILAYIGSSLSVVILLYAFNSSFTELINREMIMVEIMQMTIGSLGMLITMPITAFISAYLFSKKFIRKKDYSDECEEVDQNDVDDYFKIKPKKL